MRPSDVLLWRDDADEYIWRFLDIEELDLDDGDACDEVEGASRGDAGSGAGVWAGPGGVAPQKAAIALLETVLHEARWAGAHGNHGGDSVQQENTPPPFAAPAKKKSGKRGGAKRKAKLVLGVAETAVLQALDEMVAAQVCSGMLGGAGVLPCGGESPRRRTGRSTVAQVDWAGHFRKCSTACAAKHAGRDGDGLISLESSC